MLNRHSGLLVFFLLYDIVLIAVAFLVSLFLKYQTVEHDKYYVVLPIIEISWVLVVVLFTEENFFFRERFFQRLRSEFLDFLLFTGIVSSVLLILELNLYSRIIVFGTIGGFFILRNLGYLVLHKYLRYKRQQGRHVTKILVLGAGRTGKRLLQYATSRGNLGYRVIGFLDDEGDVDGIPTHMLLGNLQDLNRILESNKVDELVVALPFSARDKIQEALDMADFHGLRMRIIPDYFRLFNRSFKTSQLGTLPVINLRQISLDNVYHAAMKRLFDIAFSFTVLLLLSPFLIIISILVITDSKGPAFYRPVRVGKGGQQFTCLKFRTMYKNEDSTNNTKSTVAGDARITRLGKLLRKYNLDELPQFWNVLRNDMSVVGPRPHRTFLNNEMQKEVQGYMIRHYIKPGITGWAQVNGWRGPTETEEQKTQRTQHDLWYIEHWNFWLDVEIVFSTLFVRNARGNAF